MRIQGKTQVAWWAWLLRNTEEMKLFPTKEARKAALRRIEIRASKIRTALEVVFSLAILAVAFLIAYYFRQNDEIAAEFLRRPSLNAVLMFAILAPFYYRSRICAALRQELVRLGTPVCVSCCYHLDGLKPSISKCPECGASIDPRTCAVLSGAASEYKVVPFVRSDRYDAESNTPISR